MQSPKFSNPPVIETVLGLQFAELAAFRAVHFGAYWTLIRDRFPRFEDQARITPAIEYFPRRLSPALAELSLMQRSIPDRVWYITEHDDCLIQLQPDRFLLNWRSGRAKVPYTSFPENKRRFIDELNAFRSFCLNQDLGEVKPVSWEVTYINHIRPVDRETPMELFGKVFTGLSWETNSGADWLPLPESAAFNRAYVIEKEKGRLYAEANLAMNREERLEFVLLNLTARVRHEAPTLDEGLTHLQLAHDWVVNCFASITSPDFQKNRWGRIR